MADRYLGESVGKLGFGFMRLPRTKDGFDTAQINNMVDLFLANGFTYFDTAFVYEGSEEALRESLVKRHPRESFTIATKLHLMFAEKQEQLEEQFQTSRTRLGVDYIDYYLLHGLGGPSTQKAEDLDAFSFVSGLKERGLVKHFGMSYHGTPEELEGIFDRHPELEFVQLQLNYLDWDNDKVQSRKLYQTARNYDKPVVIMEPIKGGMLGSEASPIAKDFKAARPDASVASWALRFVGQLDGLITVLSGMSALNQVEDNVKTFKDLQPLDESELTLLRGAVDILNNSPRVPCTDCKYCVSKCPQNINIPAMMNLYSDYLVYRTTANVDHVYNMITRGGGKANTCVSCRACEAMCPQHIEIADNLAKFSAVIDK